MYKPKLSIEDRRKIEADKAAARRRKADVPMNRAILQGIFAQSWFGKITGWDGQRRGKHYGAHRGCRCEHPAPTKLVRSFIRRSGTESTENRKLYAFLTGHQYGHVAKKPEPVAA